MLTWTRVTLLILGIILLNLNYIDNYVILNYIAYMPQKLKKSMKYYNVLVAMCIPLPQISNKFKKFDL